MTSHLQTRLGALLDQYDETRRMAQMHKDRVAAEGTRFLDDFAALRRGLVRPLFEAAGAILKERGHEFSIKEEEFASHTAGRSTEAAITLLIAPAGMEKPPPPDEHLRALSFTTRHYNRVICVRNGAAPHEGTLAGAKGAYPLAKIDAQLVEEEIVKLMAAMVKG
jgi:hypothetical protein